jgi:hypothetical protein
MTKVRTDYRSENTFSFNSTTSAAGLCVLTRPRPSVDTRADEGAIAATKLALDKALALFLKRNDLQMAAASCVQLAELYVEQRELQTASDFFEKAAGYYGSNRRSRRCRFEAGRLRFLLANKETYRQSPDPDVRSQLYEVFATGIM